jgi:hypothetical protein
MGWAEHAALWQQKNIENLKETTCTHRCEDEKNMESGLAATWWEAQGALVSTVMNRKDSMKYQEFVTS